MSDQTTCPICHTVFRVTVISLADSKGMVQCGVCGMVFDAHLNSVPDDTTPLSISPLAADIQSELATSDIDPAVSPPETPSAFTALHPATDNKPEHITEETQFAEGQTVFNENEAVNSSPALPNIQFTKKNSRKRASLEIGFVVVLLMLLVVQFSIAYRDLLAVNFPQLVPVLNTLCTVTNCQIKLPADKNLIKINNTSFEVDPKNPNLISVHIELENQSDTVIAFPNIALSLTNDDDEVLARKNFRPKDYLTRSQTLNNGIAVHGGAAVKLTLAVSDIQATGYKLLIFYN